MGEFEHERQIVSQWHVQQYQHVNFYMPVHVAL